MAKRTRRSRRPILETLEGRALLTAGVLDPSFGSAGVVLTPNSFPNFAPDAATALYPQNDPADRADTGKIVVVGDSSTGTVAEFEVVRYNPNGSLDTSFGGTGVVKTSLSNFGSNARSVAVQPDGKIVVGGFVLTSGYPSYSGNAALARYNTNGTLDTTFGKGGLMTTGFPVSKNNGLSGGSIDSIAIEPNGEILAGGTSAAVINGNVYPETFTLALYKANGQLDTSFGTGGAVHTILAATNQGDILYGVGLQTVNGTTRIVAVGSNQWRNPGQITAVIRYNMNGTIDTTFGTNGIATLSNMMSTSEAIQPDGSIIAGGYVQSTVVINGNYYTQTHMSLARFTANGGLDTSFGQGGQVQTAFSSGIDRSGAYSVAVQPDGAIVAAGYVGTQYQPALARYTPTGQLDPTFGAAGTGMVVTPVDSNPSDTGEICGMALQADGSIVTAAIDRINSGTNFLVARYLGDPAATTTALASSLNPSTYGQPVTFTPTVVTAGPFAPSGVVDLYGDGTLLGTGTLTTVGGVTTATFTISTLASGTHSLWAIYDGDANDRTSTSGYLSQVVS